MLQFQKNLRRLLLQETAIKKPLRGRMFSVQESLPHLPVPPLQHTLDKFLRSVKPILSDDDYKRAQKVSSFIIPRSHYRAITTISLIVSDRDIQAIDQDLIRSDDILVIFRAS